MKKWIPGKTYFTLSMSVLMAVSASASADVSRSIAAADESGGYGRPKTEAKGDSRSSGGYSRPGTVSSGTTTSSTQSGGDRDMSRESGGDALERYRKQQAEQERRERQERERPAPTAPRHTDPTPTYNPPPPAPKVDTRKKYASGEITLKAKIAAEEYAKESVRAAARRERSHFDFCKGFTDANNGFRYGTDRGLRALYDSTQAKSIERGKAEGISEGRRYGANKALELAAQAANESLSAEMNHAKERGEVPTFTYKAPPVPSFRQPTLGVAPAGDPLSFVSNCESLVSSDVGNLQEARSGTCAIDQNANVSGSSAFNNWKRSRNHSQSDFYRQISDSDLTIEANVAAETFERQFVRIFDSLKTDYWRMAINETNESAKSIGRRCFETTVESAGAAVGRDQGFRTTYVTSAIESFNTSFLQTHRAEFDRKVNALENTLEVADVELFIGAGKQVKSVAVGEAISVTVTKAKNNGLKGAPVAIVAQGEGITAIDGKTIDIPGSFGKITSPVTVSNIAVLNTSAKPNTAIKINFTINRNVTVPAVVVVSWKATVARLLALVTNAETADGKDTATHPLGQYVKEQLEAEWDESGSNPGHYSNQERPSLLQELAEVTKGSWKQQAYLKPLITELREIYGEVPSWYNPRRLAWNSDTIKNHDQIMSILKSIEELQR